MVYMLYTEGAAIMMLLMSGRDIEDCGMGSKGEGEQRN